MLIFFDTETTSLEKPRLIELALWIEGEESPTTHRFKPTVKIDFEAMAAHHITEEMVENENPFHPDFEVNGKTIKELLESNVVVAHNAEFDMQVMRNEGIEIKHWICTKKLTAELYDLNGYSMQFLRYALGINTPEMSKEIVPHSAISDVRVLRALFDKLRSDLLLLNDEQEANRRMIACSQNAMIIRRFLFGKHKGEKLEDIAKDAPDYIRWLLKQEGIDNDLRWNLEQFDLKTNPHRQHWGNKKRSKLI